MKFVYAVSTDGKNFTKYSSRFPLDEMIKSIPIGAFVQWVGTLTRDNIIRPIKDTHVFYKTEKGTFLLRHNMEVF